MAVMISKNASDEQQGFSAMMWILIQEKEEKQDREFPSF